MSTQNRRSFLKKAGSAAGLTALGAIVTACGESKSQSKQGEQTGAQKTVTIEPVGNQMKFKQTEIHAPAGSELHLVFNNTATSPAMKHNVVILQNEEGIKKKVGQAAMQARDNDFIPPEFSDQIIAHTPMSDPGEKVEVTFTVPEAGEYPYICTYPGHWMTMQGTLYAEES